MALQTACPHCGRAEEDAWEVLRSDCVETVRCAQCGAHFYLALMDCPACAHETPFQWRNRPANNTLPQLICEHCAGSYRVVSQLDDELAAQALA
jgi:transcription elongation factor Elf1